MFGWVRQDDTLLVDGDNLCRNTGRVPLLNVFLLSAVYIDLVYLIPIYALTALPMVCVVLILDRQRKLCSLKQFC